MSKASLRLFALTMSCLMLVSSTGISMDLHYCQGNLMGASFVGKAKSCQDKEASLACHKKKKSCQHSKEELSQSEKDACCQNRTVQVEADETDKNITSFSPTDRQEFESVFVGIKGVTLIVNLSSKYSPQKYRPPPLTRNLPVLLQVFRL